MKFTLETDLKEIYIIETVNLGEMFLLLNALFPNDQWKTYKLVTKNENNFNHYATIDYSIEGGRTKYTPRPGTIIQPDPTNPFKVKCGKDFEDYQR